MEQALPQLIKSKDDMGNFFLISFPQSMCLGAPFQGTRLAKELDLLLRLQR